jgi:hypothetical protein
MTYDEESVAQRGGQQEPTPPSKAAKVAGGNDILGKGIVSDIVAPLVTHPAAATAVTAVGLAARAGLSVVNNTITQHGQTRREELRQQGETERARIARQASQQEPPS